MTREVTHRYEDPLDHVWRVAATRVGLRIRRSPEAYASTDGRGTLVIGSEPTLDADDCLAQMVFHELCHSLVMGPESFEEPDWGLDNETDRDLWREHACLRAQAALADRYGLRAVFAPTTDHRAFYDALPLDPLEGSERSVTAARLAVFRADRDPWGPHLAQALEASAAIVGAVVRYGSERRPGPGLPALYRAATPPRPRHPSGLFAHPDPRERRCGGCAWSDDAGGCRQAEGTIEPSWVACERFEASVACETCGACCREAYAHLELDPDDPFVERHPDLVERVDGRLALRRHDGRCPPLRGDGSEAAGFWCAIYETRPRTCRDFERESANCLDARRRVGLSL